MATTLSLSPAVSSGGTAAKETRNTGSLNRETGIQFLWRQKSQLSHSASVLNLCSHIFTFWCSLRLSGCHVDATRCHPRDELGTRNDLWHQHELEPWQKFLANKLFSRFNGELCWHPLSMYNFCFSCLNSTNDCRLGQRTSNGVLNILAIRSSHGTLPVTSCGVVL